MLDVKFYESIEDSKLDFAVIVSKKDNQWVYCKHRDRSTYEVPGGHREQGEDILATANRELYEETGAIDYLLKPICVYSVTKYDENNELENETFGMLFFAEIYAFGPLPELETEKVLLFDDLPAELTYPLIQPV